MKTALSIAGSDPSGGAGIQGDLKTFAAHGVYGMAAITAITAQNTLGVFAVEPIAEPLVGAQLDAVFADIFPDAVKIGMIPGEAAARAVAEALSRGGARSVVVDTPMVSSSGRRLLDEGAERALVELLFPRARLVTPNVPEAEALTGIAIRDRDGMSKAARVLSSFTPGGVLLKGGHLEDAADDLLLADGEEIWYRSARIYSRHTHGTGCALSSAIAANLARGLSLAEAVKAGKEYVRRAILAAPGLGRGNGPLRHDRRI
jgi:hydroxymethylpyrimidine/phosphomethylpyrimidine kinase